MKDLILMTLIIFRAENGNMLSYCYVPDCWSNAACSLGGQYIPLAVVLPEVSAALK